MSSLARSSSTDQNRFFIKQSHKHKSCHKKNRNYSHHRRDLLKSLAVWTKSLKKSKLSKSRKKRSKQSNSVQRQCTNNHLQRESFNRNKNSVKIKDYRLEEQFKTTRKILTQPWKSPIRLRFRNMIVVIVRKSETRKWCTRKDKAQSMRLVSQASKKYLWEIILHQ